MIQTALAQRRMTLRPLAAVLLTFSFCASSANAGERWIVRAQSGGNNSLARLCQSVGCNTVQSLGDPQSRLFLVDTATSLSSLNLNGLLSGLLGKLGLIDLEPDLLLTVLPGTPGAPLGAVPKGLFERAPKIFSGSVVWSGYEWQPAALIVHAPQARARSRR